MKITVASTLNTRPELVAQTLGSLALVRGIEDCRWVACAEPNDVDVHAIAHAFDACEKQIRHNPVQLGILLNTYQCLQDALETDPDFIVHVEDDVLLSADLLEYFKWAAEHYAADASVYAICAHSHIAPTPSQFHYVWRRAWFAPWCWGIWPERLAATIDEWDYTGNLGGWDWNMNLHMRHGRDLIFPYLSRVQHMGKIGTYSNENNFDYSQAPLFAGDVALPPNQQFKETDRCLV